MCRILGHRYGGWSFVPASSLSAAEWSLYRYCPRCRTWDDRRVHSLREAWLLISRLTIAGDMNSDDFMRLARYTTSGQIALPLEAATA